MKNMELFKFPKNENILIALLIILVLNVFTNYLEIDADYYFNGEQIETIFYVQENIPQNSTILVPDLDKQNYLYDLLIGYKLKMCDNSKRGLYDSIRGKLTSSKERFAIVDTSVMNPIDLKGFLSDEKFIILFRNDINIVLEYNY